MIAWRWVGSGAPAVMLVPGANALGSAMKAFSAACVQVPPLAFSALEYWKSERLATLRPTTPLSAGAVMLGGSTVWQLLHTSLNASSPGNANAGAAANAGMTRASTRRMDRLRVQRPASDSAGRAWPQSFATASLH